MSLITWTLKIVILGEPSVGKTSLRRTYLGEKFDTNYLSTIGADFSYKQLELEEGRVNIALWDLAGQILHRNVNPQYFRGAAGAIVVYDVSKQDSFDKVKEWVEKYLLHSNNPKGPILVIGNKTDLLSKEETEVSEHQQTELIKSLHSENPHIHKFISSRTSAKMAQNVSSSFRQLTQEIITWELEHDQTSRRQIGKEEIDKYVKASYILGFHEMYGPKIISREPRSHENMYSNSELSSAIKISAVHDFDSIAENFQSAGSFPWSDPLGNFNYIAFTVNNPNARGSKGLYIIGLVSSREISDVISTNRSVIDGYLHSCLNKFVTMLSEIGEDFVTGKSIVMDEDDAQHKFRKILNSLRNEVFELIRNKI